MPAPLHASPSPPLPPRFPSSPSYSSLSFFPLIYFFLVCFVFYFQKKKQIEVSLTSVLSLFPLRKQLIFFINVSFIHQKVGKSCNLNRKPVQSCFRRFMNYKNVGISSYKKERKVEM
ncbi:Uncharacterized protein TCM_000379 [Theobroma cacao]|uniref:Uncharacterized protein n=1 Tax=Theobroma cacao TaxID=3641 RepID=A0A061DM88_THECC|nr:Uncharacterized protein TCM_000379 [Theobroma cacao]